MSFLDFIKNLFSNGKTNTKITTKDLTKIKGEPDRLEVSLTDKDNKPLSNKNITIEINTVKYTKTTDENGLASLNINLNIGDYKALFTFDGDDEYNKSTAHCKVYVNPKITTKDLNMTSGDGSKFTATITDSNNTLLNNISVTFNINGKDYVRTSDENGKASLNINLNPGKYPIKTSINNIILENNINISEKTVTDKKHFGYWIFGKDMTNVNINQLKNNGVTDIFLNYYAFNTHGEEKVKEFIEKAKDINVHIWMQCFYDGEWHNPVNTDLNSKIDEATKYANIPNVKGVHLDYLRYPGNAYKTDGGAEAITNFVSKVREAIPKNIILSCAVMPENETKKYYGQDITALGKIVDAIIPMQYKGNYNAGTSWLASTTKNFTIQATIWSGLQSYKSDDDTTLLSSEELNNDIKTCLDNGAKGAILFRYGLSNTIDFKPYNNSSSGKKDTRMEGTNINMTYKDGTKYQCAVYDPNNNRVKDTVKLTVNGVTYSRNADSEGLYKLNINLNPGTYDLKAVFEGNSVYNGSSILNNIVINPAPTPEPKKECTNPYTSSPHPTSTGCNGMGQNNSYCCGPSSIHKAIWKFGIRDISQNQIASWAGTTSAGSSHQGLETAIAKINQVKGTNISITWYNLSDLGWEGLGKLICQDNIAAFTHILYKNGGTCSGSGNFGHYEAITKINLATGYVKVINSLGDYCGSCYCGYYQDRTIACEEVFISGISQKSIAVLKMN